MDAVQIAVLTKLIPNPEATQRLDADGLLVREGGVLDQGDEPLGELLSGQVKPVSSTASALSSSRLSLEAPVRTGSTTRIPTLVST
jgi:hypothetical protein